ncbi:MAG: S53 family peptidase, partial [Terriglobus roseus]|nr:S53 family peptidase [Terriglobus roseus]
DNRPQAKPHFRRAAHPHTPGTIVHPHAVNTSYTPVAVAELYGLPSGSNAEGQTIALLELGGGFKPADISTYFEALGRPVPSVTAVSVDKGKNKPSGPNGADGEVMLDIEVAAAVAPGAKIVVYFAPNTDQGFIDAIGTAIHDETHNPSILSISWGGPESSWTEQSRNALDQACQSAAALGVTILAAAGDDGSSDGASNNQPNVDFPASSPHVLACGGTKLVGSGTTIQSEVVWNETASNEGATGGGISTVFPQPAWQSKIAATKKGRGVPDVSGNADPTTGYQVRVDGENTVIGGTSAVAPLWAGILAVINAQSKMSVGFLQPKLYAANAASSFRDITSGSNGAYKAAKGWDACTGLGSPNIPNLITLLAPSTSTKKPKPTKPTKKHTEGRDA